jgi:hypothetical protein
MIRGRLRTTVLARAADATRGPRFDAIHEAFRRFFLSGIIPSVGFVLRRALRPARVSLVARNSVLEPRNFRVFESDLDASLVFEGAVAEDSLALGRRLYARLQRWLPMLGELEIYERRELRLKEKVAAAAGPVVDMIWLLRKWSWQHKRLSEAPSLYHRRKAERSIRRIQDRLNLSGVALFPTAADARTVGARVDAQLKGLPRRDPGGPIDAPAGFLEWGIRSSESAESRSGELRLFCAGPAALALLSILPDGEILCPQEREKLEDLRRTPQVARTLLAVALAEWSLLRSVERTNPEAREEERRSWRRRLEAVFRASPGSDLLSEFPEFAE